jgi:hypothetical protein
MTGRRIKRKQGERSEFDCMGEGCGEIHAISAWAAAHMRDGIVHTCPECGTRHDLAGWFVTLAGEAAA